MNTLKVMVVGCGAMGSALIQGWLEAHICKDLIIIDPQEDKARKFLSMPGVVWYSTPSETLGRARPDAIIFAVKPQKLSEILPHYASFKGSSLFISVAAGHSLSFYEQSLGPGAPLVRVMPNLAVSLRHGVSVGFADSSLLSAHRTLTNTLFASLGAMAWCEEEALLDTATVVSGSGLAYFYGLVECLAQAAIERGLAEDLAYLLARQTAIGAGAMLDTHEESPELLRGQVTSPGGVTEAALEVLLSGERGLPSLLKQVLNKGLMRSAELGSN